MNAVVKVSPTNIIMEYVNNRVLPPTRHEIIRGTGLSVSQVRKATNDLVNKGKLSVDYDNHGIPTYSTKKMAKVAPKTISVVSKSVWKEDNLQKPATAAWATATAARRTSRCSSSIARCAKPAMTSSAPTSSSTWPAKAAA